MACFDSSHISIFTKHAMAIPISGAARTSNLMSDELIPANHANPIITNSANKPHNIALKKNRLTSNEQPTAPQVAPTVPHATRCQTSKCGSLATDIYPNAAINVLQKIAFRKLPDSPPITTPTNNPITIDAIPPSIISGASSR